MTITLYMGNSDSSANTTCTESSKDLVASAGAEYTYAKVNSGNWIFYELANYNNSSSSSKFLVLKEAEVGGTRVALSGCNRSLFRLPTDDEALVLFNGYRYARIDPDPQVSCHGLHFAIVKMLSNLNFEVQQIQNRYMLHVHVLFTRKPLSLI